MSIRALGHVFQCGPTFKATDKLVLLALANYANGETGKCYPSIREIAWCTGLSERTVHRVLNRLETCGIATILRGGGRRSNEYFLNFDWLQFTAERLQEVKAAARIDGADRYERMAVAALECRRKLDEVAEHQNAAWDNEEVSLGAGDAGPGERGDPESELDAGLVARDASVAAAASTACPDARTASPGSPDATSPEPVIESTYKPLVQPSQNEKHCVPVRETDERMRPGIEAAYSALAYVDRLSDKLGMKTRQICMGLGSLTEAEALAKKWIKGDVSIDEIRQLMSEPRTSARKGCGGGEPLTGPSERAE